MKIWVLIFRWKRIKNFLKAHRRNWLKWILEVDTQPFKVKFYDDCAGGVIACEFSMLKPCRAAVAFDFVSFFFVQKKVKLIHDSTPVDIHTSHI